MKWKKHIGHHRLTCSLNIDISLWKTHTGQPLIIMTLKKVLNEYESNEEALCSVIFAEGQSGGGGGQWPMQREAAGQTVRRLFLRDMKLQIKKKNTFWFILCFLPHRLVSVLTLLSKKLNCYKITLECADKNVAFYQKFGYTSSNETYMQCRFFDWGQQQPLKSLFRGEMDHTHTFSTKLLKLNKSQSSSDCSY